MDYIAAIGGAESATRDLVTNFIDSNTPNSLIGTAAEDHHKSFLLSVMHGALYTKREFDFYAQTNDGQSLKEGQDPNFFGIFGSNEDALPEYFVGQSLLGETLALRMPGSKIIDDYGILLSEVNTYIALVQSKNEHSGRDTPLLHTKDDSNKLIELAYAYFEAGCDRGAPLPIIFNEATPSQIDQSKRYRALYREAKANGLEYYAKKGINFKAAKNRGEKMKLAMTAEALIMDVSAYPQYTDAKPDMLPVLHSKFTESHYVYLADKDEFVTVPAHDKNPKKNRKKMLKFLKRLPGFDDGADTNDTRKAAWQYLGYALSVGFTRYKHRKDLERAQNLPNSRVLQFAVMTCADARQPAWVFVGRPKDSVDPSAVERYEVYAFRNAGILVTGNRGELTDTAIRFLEFSALQGLVPIYTGHTDCGAMQATDKELSGNGENLAEAFRKHGKELTHIYEKVGAGGDANAQCIISSYSKKMGIPMKTIDDCISVQSWMDSLEALRKHSPDVKGAFHDTRNGDLYIENVHRENGSPVCIRVEVVDGLRPKNKVNMAPRIATEAMRAFPVRQKVLSGTNEKEQLTLV